MRQSTIRCPKCGEWFYGRTPGEATAVWREHVMTDHLALSVGGALLTADTDRRTS
jgi:hypothetical protein